MCFPVYIDGHFELCGLGVPSGFGDSFEEFGIYKSPALQSGNIVKVKYTFKVKKILCLKLVVVCFLKLRHNDITHSYYL